jgi:hypothetical protein
VKSIILYTRELKPQNLYPKRIISPPAPNKCCPGRMEVLGRPRLDEQSRRFYYKRCKVCGFALRHFLDPVGTVLTPATNNGKIKKPTPPPSLSKDRLPLLSMHTPRRPQSAARKSLVGHHARRAPTPPRPHRAEAGRKSAARRRR